MNAPLTCTPIAAAEVAPGDYLIVKNPELPRFAVKVERLGAGGTYFVGKVFSIGTLSREGLVAFNGRTKIVSLRPRTAFERVAR